MPRLQNTKSARARENNDRKRKSEAAERASERRRTKKKKLYIRVYIPVSRIFQLSGKANRLRRPWRRRGKSYTHTPREIASPSLPLSSRVIRALSRARILETPIITGPIVLPLSLSMCVSAARQYPTARGGGGGRKKEADAPAPGHPAPSLFRRALRTRFSLRMADDDACPFFSFLLFAARDSWKLCERSMRLSLGVVIRVYIVKIKSRG